MRQSHYHIIPRTKGFSIIELMISLLLGSALLVLSFNLYFSTKQSELLATTVLNTQTEARNALHFIRQGIEHAGFTTKISTQAQRDLIFKANSRFKAGQVIQVESTDNINQSLLVRAQGDEDKPLRACNGEVIPPAPPEDSANISLTEIWYEFYIDENMLKCQVYKDGIQTDDPLTLAAPVMALKLRAFTENASTTAPTTHVRETLKDISTNEKTKSIQVQLVIRSTKKIRQENKLTTIPVTGFDDLEFDDTYFYVNTNRFFLAQNQ